MNHLDRLPSEIVDYIYSLIWKENIEQVNQLMSNEFVYVHTCFDISTSVNFSERVTRFNNKTRLTRYVFETISDRINLITDENYLLLRIIAFQANGMKNIEELFEGDDVARYDSFILP